MQVKRYAWPGSMAVLYILIGKKYLSASAFFANAGTVKNWLSTQGSVR
jgi:hypothetical protein